MNQPLRQRGMARAGLATLALGISLTVSACGGTHRGHSATSLASASTQPAASHSGANQTDTTIAAAAKHFTSFTGGKLGSASATESPVVIGYFNDQGGVPSFPEGTAAAKAAVDFVNHNLGGADGHPVVLSTCLPLSEAQGQSCADQFLNDKHLKIAIEGLAPTGSASFFATMNGRKPVIEAVPATPNDATAKNAYGISSGGFAAGNDASYIARTLHAKKVGVIGASDDPGSVAAVAVLKKALSHYSVSTTVGTYQTTSGNLLPALEASGGNANDVIYSDTVSTANCVAGAKAVQEAQITKPVIGTNGCITAAVKHGLGDFPKWTTRWNSLNPYDPAGQADVTSYDAVMRRYAAGSEIGGTAAESFAAVLVAVRMYDKVGSGASISALSNGMKHFIGPAPMLPPHLKFGSIPGEPALGTLASRMYSYEGHGQWKNASGWL